MEDRVGYLLGRLDSAIKDFERSMGIDASALEPVLADLVRNGQVQKFEFTIELFWKTVKAFLLDLHGCDAASPKSAIKKYFELGYVGYEQCDALLKGLDIRNSLSNVYKKERFLELYEAVSGYSGVFEATATGMLKKE